MSCKEPINIDLIAGQPRSVLLRPRTASTGQLLGAPHWSYRLEIFSPWGGGLEAAAVPFGEVALLDGPALRAEIPAGFTTGRLGGRYTGRIVRRYEPTGWEHPDVPLSLAVRRTEADCRGDLPDEGLIVVPVSDSEIVTYGIVQAVLPLYDPVVGVTIPPLPLKVTQAGQTLFVLGGAESRRTLWVNGLRYWEGTDYTITLPNLTWQGDFTLVPGDTVTLTV